MQRWACREPQVYRLWYQVQITLPWSLIDLATQLFATEVLIDDIQIVEPDDKGDALQFQLGEDISWMIDEKRPELDSALASISRRQIMLALEPYAGTCR